MSKALSTPATTVADFGDIFVAEFGNSPNTDKIILLCHGCHRLRWISIRYNLILQACGA